MLLVLSTACANAATGNTTTSNAGNGTSTGNATSGASGAQPSKVVKLKAVSMPPSPLDLQLNANKVNNKAVGTAVITNPSKDTVEVRVLASCVVDALCIQCGMMVMAQLCKAFAAGQPRSCPA